jgi:hypothetical protein
MRVETFAFKDTETLTVGDLVNIEATSNIGEADLAVTSDILIAGVVFGADDPDDQVAAGTIAGTDSTTKIQVITNADMVYSIVDANARAAGAPLDITGATGSQTLTSASNNEFIVVKNSTATEETEVVIAPSAHYLFIA